MYENSTIYLYNRNTSNALLISKPAGIVMEATNNIILPFLQGTRPKESAYSSAKSNTQSSAESLITLLKLRCPRAE